MRHRLQDAVARWLVRRDWVVYRPVRIWGDVRPITAADIEQERLVRERDPKTGQWRAAS